MNNSPSLQNLDEIYPIPEIPSDIKSAVSNEKLIVFIGAGASRVIGCLGWKELADHLVDVSFKHKLINHWEQERLRTGDPRKIISILKKVLPQPDYEKALEKSLKAKSDLLEKFPIYKHLIKLRSIYITTNIDTYFDSFFEQSRIYIEPSQFKSENLMQNTLFKVHGSITAHKTVIFTTQDYISHYNRPEIKAFLESIFNDDYTVLFVGYSLAELEILDYVLLKGNTEKLQISALKEAKQFLLLPFYRSEKGLLRFERAYFDTLNVVTVPYAIDDRGHNQLHFVIEVWEKEINISTPYLFKSYKFIEDNVSDYVASNASEVLQLIKNDEHFRDHFFRRVKTIKWFTPLKEKEYFSPENAPAPFLSGQEGFYSIPEWNVLPYLEQVSQQTNIPGNEKYIDDLLTIIKDVSNYRDSSGQHIDNYRTWYYFTKILVNLPTAQIPEEIISLIPVWLDSKFSTSLPGAEIAGKLLPKFLNSDNPEDWKKAERLIEIITDIKWIPVPESQRNNYERDIEARILIEPYWLRKGFEKRFESIGTVCSTRVIDTIAKRILNVFSKQHDHAYDVDYEGKKYQIAHSLIEGGGHKISVHSLRIPEDWDGFSQSTIGKTLVTSFDISDFENMAAFVTKVKEGLIKHAFHSLGTELDETISFIYSMHDYTYIGYSSLSVSPDHIHINDTKKILIYILKEILIVKAQHDRAETSKVLDKFLSREYPYPFFKRLVLFVAAREWDKYKEYFFKVINMEEVRCFEESDYAKELSILIKDNFSKFNPDEKEIIKKIIESGPQLLPDENPEKYTAYWKQKWLSLMKDDPLFAPIFGEQKKVTGIEKERFNFGTEFRTSEGPGPSPLSTEEILKLTRAELAIKLKEFRSEKKWEGMTVAGFSVALKEAVMTNPSKFTDNLSHFEDVGFIYVYKILDGLKDTWKTKKTIDWGKVFDFVVPYIKKDEFWKDKYIVESGAWLGGADHGWIISMVAELIQEGTKDDSWAFPEESFDEAKEIVFTLLQEPEEVEEISDYVSHTLNTTCGKLITALVYLALRIARVNKKEGIKNDPRWMEEFKKKFDELLGGKVIDAYTSLGRFLPSLSYLDKEWVKGKIEQTISEKESKYWQAFMEGYLSGGSVYDDLYSLMRPHYEYGLSCEFKQHDREYLIQHICVGYLRGRENLDDPNSLFRKIIDAWRPEQIREVIGFFWMQRGILMETTEENEKMRGKIIEFWRLLYKKYKDKVSLTREDKHILSDVSKLATFLPKIETESYEWLMISSPYVHENFNSSFFIEYLDELKNKGDGSKTAKYVGDIYLKMLEKITPDYDQKHIQSIVEFLYKSSNRENAKKICNIYGTRGYEFLRDIYEKHSNGA